MWHLITTLMLGASTMLVAGCSETNYYRVTDVSSGKAYYTTKIGDAGKGGAVKIQDEKTGSMVTLQSSEVKKISENEYEEGIMEEAPVRPAPARPAPVQPESVQPAATHVAPLQPTSVQPAVRKLPK